jgi:hypothetical protein
MKIKLEPFLPAAAIVALLSGMVQASDRTLEISLPKSAKQAPLSDLWIAGNDWRIAGDGVENDDLESPVITFQQSNPDSPVDFALLNETIDGDFRLDAKIKVFGDLSSYSGLIFFAKSSDELFRLYFADGGKLWKWSKESGNVELMAGVNSLGLRENNWFWMRVDVIGNRFKAYISDDGAEYHEVLSYDFAEDPPPAGMVGLAGCNHVNFQSIKLSSLSH